MKQAGGAARRAARKFSHSSRHVEAREFQRQAHAPGPGWIDPPGRRTSPHPGGFRADRIPPTCAMPRAG